MSTPRLTFLYPFLFAPAKPSTTQRVSRIARRGLQTSRHSSQDTVNQRYGTANEPLPHLSSEKPIGPPRPKDAAPKDAKQLPKPPIGGLKRKEDKDKEQKEAKQEPEKQASSDSKRDETDRQNAETNAETKQSTEPEQQPKDEQKPPAQQEVRDAKEASQSTILDSAESRPTKPPPPSPHVPAPNPLETILNMPSSDSQHLATAPVYAEATSSANVSKEAPFQGPPTKEQAEAQKPPHISTPPYVHHFDTYGLVRRLEDGGWTNQQAVTIMKAVRLILSGNMDLATEGLVSKSNVENETYLFRAACSELRTEVNTRRKAESERLRTERAQLQHEVDILGQRLTQEGGNLKDELKGMFDDRKMAVRQEQREMESKIQELNYRITVSLTSDQRSEVEGVRWVITKRAIGALALCVTMILCSLKFASSMMHWQEEDRKRMAALGSGQGNNGNGSGKDDFRLGQEDARRQDQARNEAVVAAGEILVKEGDNPAYVSLG